MRARTNVPRLSRICGGLIVFQLTVGAPVAIGQPSADRLRLLTVRTVPPLEGVRFSVNGQEMITDNEGAARLALPGRTAYRVEAFPWEGEQPDAKASFAIWDNGSFEPIREVQVRDGPVEIVAGFEVSYAVHLDFVDVAGRVVDPQRIGSLHLRSSHGMPHKLDRPEVGQLQANRIMRRLTGLEALPLRYTVEEMIIDGASVVNRGQQRFSVEPDVPWRIEVLLFSARFVSRDALFDTPIGSGIHLQYPDGRRSYLPFGPDSELTVRSLARGIYRVQVETSGYSPSTPVALTRDQVVSLKVVSRLDLALAAAFVMIVAAGLLLAGRPHLLGILFRRGARGNSAGTGRLRR